MSEQLERLTDAEIAKMLKDCMATSEPALYAVRLLLLEVSAHRRAERPGCAEAIEAAEHEMAIWSRLLPHPQDGTSDLRHLHSLAAFRLIKARAALHPSVAEGRTDEKL